MCKLVNKANLVHNLFLVYLSICGCFGRLCAHHQEKQLSLCDTWYLLFCVDDWYAGWNEVSFHPAHRITSTKCFINSCFSWWRANSHPKHVEIDKYTKNKLCTKLALFTRLYRDAQWTEHRIWLNVHFVNLQMCNNSEIFFFTENHENCGVI